eukprot:TRINITY_DN11514_c0_g1_i1.p1 TRINITY_DN11514_c0_g1~~TRINITY_DN11514_c0_g1_i1.p1  ORF type:complete len:732 (-),score=175.28 TRINITY_DN11514_c0_g1_i1:128-2323(-)
MFLFGKGKGSLYSRFIGEGDEQDEEKGLPPQPNPPPSEVVVVQSAEEQLERLLHAPGNTFTCGICCDEVKSADSICYQCPDGHFQCVKCFGDYMKHCCSSWATLNTVPVTCFIPQCKYRPSELQIKALCQDPQIDVFNLWEVYLQTEMRVAIANKALNREDDNEITVTCSSCGNYAEVFVKADPKYWERVKDDRFRVQAKQQIHMFQEAKRMKDNLEKKIQEGEAMDKDALDQKLEMEAVMAESGVLYFENLINRAKLKLQEIEANLPHVLLSAPEADGKRRSSSVEPRKDYDESYLQTLLQYQGDPENVSGWVEVRDSLKSELKVLGAFLQKSRRKKAELSSEDNDRAKAFFERQRLEGLDRIQIALDEEFSRDQKHEIQSSTSQFFVCKNLFCDGAYCLRCESFLKKEEMQSHFCKLDEADKLYFLILDALAESSTRKCPSCGTAGKKDLACTHITCDKCRIRFCYVCGLSEQDIGSFSVHNTWSITTVPDEKRCPMYLHYKYGTVPNGNVMEGDPAESLDKFHLDLQRQAIDSLKKEVNNRKLWAKVETERFNGRIIPPPYVPPFKVRMKAYAKTYTDRWIRVSVVLYVLWFLAIPFYMLVAGAQSLHLSCSSKLPAFLITHGSLSLFEYTFGMIGLWFHDIRPRGHTCTRRAGFLILFCLFVLVAMLGTFIWGCVEFYKTSSTQCSHTAYLAGLIYFDSVWSSTGYFAFCFLCWVAISKYFDVNFRP